LVGVSDGRLGRRPVDGLSVSKRQAPSPCPGTPLGLHEQASDSLVSSSCAPNARRCQDVVQQSPLDIIGGGEFSGKPQPASIDMGVHHGWFPRSRTGRAEGRPGSPRRQLALPQGCSTVGGRWSS
jgi:hypothetical protein